MTRKYIHLFEEYTDLEQKSLTKNHSWQDIRDTIQSKLPFIIIDFKSKKSFDKCLKEELFDEDIVKQVYHYKTKGDEVVKLPSIFIVEKGKGLKNRVKDLTNRFKILRIIIGEYGKEIPQLYFDGENMDYKSNLYSSIELNDMGGDDFYTAGSNNYKFVD